ncbi:MAG: DUF86 domain-containing protein [Candidatus Hydrogenedentota bacterium]
MCRPRDIPSIGGIPWRDIIGMRNMLIHGYDIVDLDILWHTVDEDRPALIAIIEPLIENGDGA